MRWKRHTDLRDPTPSSGCMVGHEAAVHAMVNGLEIGRSTCMTLQPARQASCCITLSKPGRSKQVQDRAARELAKWDLPCQQLRFSWQLFSHGNPGRAAAGSHLRLRGLRQLSFGRTGDPLRSSICLRIASATETYALAEAELGAALTTGSPPSAPSRISMFRGTWRGEGFVGFEGEAWQMAGDDVSWDARGGPLVTTAQVRHIRAPLTTLVAALCLPSNCDGRAYSLVLS